MRRDKIASACLTGMTVGLAWWYGRSPTPIRPSQRLSDNVSSESVVSSPVCLSEGSTSSPSSVPPTTLRTLKPGTTEHSEYATHLTDVLAMWTVEEKELPGLSLAVMKEGRLVYAKGFGLADVEHQTPASGDTVYRIASISKPITTAVMMKLVEDNKLDLDEPIQQRLLPSFPLNDGNTITARQLATHTSGIRHYHTGKAGYDAREFQSTVRYKDVNDANSAWLSRGEPFVGPPGSTFKYSTHGYTALSCVIQAAAGGTPFLDLVHNLLTASDVTGIQPDKAEDIVPHRARPYICQTDNDGNSVLVNAPHVDVSAKYAGGGFMASMPAVCGFGNAVLVASKSKEDKPGQILKQSTVLNDLWGSGAKYGKGRYALGWALSESQVLGSLASHSGGAMGASSDLLIARDVDVVCAAAANRSQPGVGLRKLNKEAARLWSQPITVPERP